MRLPLQDFSGVFKQGLVLPLGGVLQYTIMPLMGFLVSRFAALPTPMAVGQAALWTLAVAILSVLGMACVLYGITLLW